MQQVKLPRTWRQLCPNSSNYFWLLNVKGLNCKASKCLYLKKKPTNNNLPSHVCRLSFQLVLTQVQSESFFLYECFASLLQPGTGRGAALTSCQAPAAKLEPHQIQQRGYSRDPQQPWLAHNPKRLDLGTLTAAYEKASVCTACLCSQSSIYSILQQHGNPLTRGQGYAKPSHGLLVFHIKLHFPYEGLCPGFCLLNEKQGGSCSVEKMTTPSPRVNTNKPTVLNSCYFCRGAGSYKEDRCL